MSIILSPQAAAALAPFTLAIGNFDGVHLGHQALVTRTIAWAHQLHARPAALTFHPHPTRILAPGLAPQLLTTLEQRAGLLGRYGLDALIVEPFTRDLSLLSPRDFIEQILVRQLLVKAIIVGENFRFGYRQSGDVETLRQLGREFEFIVDTLPLVQWRGLDVSSSNIRRFLAQGHVHHAARLLGHWYALEGPVVRGFGIGSTQTVPTLNLQPAEELLPAHGVYVTRVLERQGSQRAWPAVTNVGTRPTFDGHAVTIESFLLDGYQPPPPETIRVEFLHHLRPERRFPSPALLKSQILRDVMRAHRFHQRYQRLQATNGAVSSDSSPLLH